MSRTVNRPIWCDPPDVAAIDLTHAGAVVVGPGEARARLVCEYGESGRRFYDVEDAAGARHEWPVGSAVLLMGELGPQRRLTAEMVAVEGLLGRGDCEGCADGVPTAVATITTLEGDILDGLAICVGCVGAIAERRLR